MDFNFPSLSYIRLPIHGEPIEISEEMVGIIKRVVKNSINKKFAITEN